MPGTAYANVLITRPRNYWLGIPEELYTLRRKIVSAQRKYCMRTKDLRQLIPPADCAGCFFEILHYERN